MGIVIAQKVFQCIENESPVVYFCRLIKNESGEELYPVFVRSVLKKIVGGETLVEEVLLKLSNVMETFFQYDARLFAKPDDPIWTPFKDPCYKVSSVDEFFDSVEKNRDTLAGRYVDQYAIDKIFPI